MTDRYDGMELDMMPMADMELDLVPMANMELELEALGVTPAQYAALDARVQANTDAVGVLDNRVDEAGAEIGARYTKDEVDGLLAEKADLADSLTIKNLITNGDFAQGTTGWRNFYSVLTVENGIAKVVASGMGLAHIRTEEIGNITDVFYCSLLAKKENATDDVLRILFGNFGIDYSIGLSWTKVSRLGTGVANGLLSFYILKPDLSNPSIGATLYLDNIVYVNLTKTFGAGNEPTKLEMDELMKVIPNQWWDGELSLTQKQFITWQLNLIRKNTNAIIALGGTII